MRPPSRRVWLGLLIGAAVVGFGWWALAGQWAAVRESLGLLRLRPAPLAAATVLVCATYGLLIQLWRVVLHRWGEHLSFVDATRIWSISNLGRFIPGRVAQIGAMAYLSRERGVSGVAAAGSALLNTLINIAAGTAVALAAGGRLLDQLSPGASELAIGLVALAVLGLLALPWLLPRLVGLAARLLKREAPAGARMPASAVWLTAAGNVVAWVLYGLAFQLFTAGVLGSAAGAPAGYLAVYSASYIVGYLVVFAPGGIGAREAALVAAMVALDLATLPEATLVAVASRLWLTVLEVLPGLLFLAHASVRGSPRSSPGDAPS